MSDAAVLPDTVALPPTVPKLARHAPALVRHAKSPSITTSGPLNPPPPVQRWTTSLPWTCTAPCSVADAQSCAITSPPISDGYWRPSITSVAPAPTWTPPTTVTRTSVHVAPAGTTTSPDKVPVSVVVHGTGVGSFGAPTAIGVVSTTSVAGWSSLADGAAEH